MIFRLMSKCRKYGQVKGIFKQNSHFGSSVNGDMEMDLRRRGAQQKMRQKS
jgi:hypothetical protein